MISEFVQSKRKALGLTQERLSEISGVGIRFIRDLEQNKATLRLDKINQVLSVFGCCVGVIQIPKDIDASQIK
jgi:y4mF family transcriptional regulator